jgi:hypothetical protein
VLFLDPHEFSHELVVSGVRDLGGVQDIITVVVVFDEPSELFGASPEVVPRV